MFNEEKKTLIIKFNDFHSSIQLNMKTSDKKEKLWKKQMVNVGRKYVCHLIDYTFQLFNSFFK
jgi:hypothetical protein